MRLTQRVAERISRRMNLDGYALCTPEDVWQVYRDGELEGRESLCSRIMQEFDEYEVEV